ncbi:Aldehyde dehydrogenase [Meloidogyne graminicola]|uniref:Aldehyde dehydrogenase n=1 Tax=Meloidogyne graminicola TaxID=189291 RepID=A0A8S9ZJB8_9BILA|nr:Aldehyde dehydrogenase [Meloidogyne graminicola]
MTTNIAEIVTNQRNFFKTGATKSLTFRKEQLQKLKSMIKENDERIVEAIYKDLRRPKDLNMQMEIGGSLATIDLCLENLDEWAKPIKLKKISNNSLGEPEIQYEPKGVVLVIGAWNYPAMLIIQPAAEAIAAGNTVIIKPSEVSANTSHLMKELFDKNFPKNFITVIEGAAEETLEILNERFDHIFYTGNTTIGKVIMIEAAKNLTPVTLELGGKCPVIVENDADIDKAAKRIAEGKWLNSGQTCLAPDYIMTTLETKPKLVEALRKSINLMYGNDPQKSPNYSRMVNQRHFDRVNELMKASKGKVILQIGKPDRSDVFIPPTIMETDLKDSLMQEEVFGPALPILTVKDLDEAIKIINDGEKPLGAYLFTENENKIEKFLNSTSSGGVTINDIIKHAMISELPFGGIGNSGIGSYHGKHGFIQLSHAKAILKRRD